jgi:hypothetical protein
VFLEYGLHAMSVLLKYVPRRIRGIREVDEHFLPFGSQILRMGDVDKQILPLGAGLSVQHTEDRRVEAAVVSWRCLSKLHKRSDWIARCSDPN